MSTITAVIKVVQAIQKTRNLVDLIQDLKDTGGISEDAYQAILQAVREIEDTISEDEVPF